jgi:hypothetical protein
MFSKFLKGVKTPAQLFLIRREVMYGAMAVSAYTDRRLHFFSGEVLFEPFIPVARTRNQVMFRRTLLGYTLAKVTLSRVRNLASDVHFR